MYNSTRVKGYGLRSLYLIDLIDLIDFADPNP